MKNMSVEVELVDGKYLVNVFYHAEGYKKFIFDGPEKIADLFSQYMLKLETDEGEVKIPF